MEIRHNIYYPGNTIKQGKFTEARQKHIMSIGIGGYVHEGQVPLHEDKIFATNRCVWCNKAFGQYLPVCIACHNCQYCGYFSNLIVLCLQCGNRQPTEFMHPFNRDRLET